MCKSHSKKILLTSLVLVISILTASSSTHAESTKSLCSRLERRIAIATRQIQRLATSNASKISIRIQKALISRYTKQHNNECKTPRVTPSPTPTGTMPPEDSIMCMTVYKPVCGRRSIQQTCDRGDIKCVLGININTIDNKTYSNLCFLHADRATYLYDGPCKEPGSDDGAWCGLPPYFCPPGAACFVGPLPPQTYRSLAELQEAGAQPLHPGQCASDESCKIDRPVCGILTDNCTKFACTNVQRVPQMFRNLCELERAGAQIVYRSLCKAATF